MIGWLQPVALWGLALVAGPIVVHLLKTRYAQRAPFPSLRFVTPSTTAAVRLRPPSDLRLLALRSAIVVLAVCAAAQPLILTSSRQAAWDARVARVVVVDASASMRSGADAGQPPSTEAAAIADAELRAAAAGLRIDAETVADAIPRAIAWLQTALPARREIVVISDFQVGSVAPEDLRAVPRDTGVRVARVGTLPARRTLPGMPVLNAPGQPGREQEIELTASGTRASLVIARKPESGGLRMIAPAGREAEANRLLGAVATAGAPGPSSSEPLAFSFSGSGLPRSTGKLSPWMVRTLARLQENDQLNRAARSTTAQGSLREDDGIVVLRDGRRAPLATAITSGAELAFHIAADVTSYIAAAVVQSVLTARHGRVDLREAEVRSLSGDELFRMTRQPGPVPADAWKRSDASDARWCWLAVLVLIAVEQWVRRRPAETAEGERRAAA